jgi:hypothetical protein
MSVKMIGMATMNNRERLSRSICDKSLKARSISLIIFFLTIGQPPEEHTCTHRRCGVGTM